MKKNVARLLAVMWIFITAINGGLLIANVLGGRWYLALINIVALGFCYYGFRTIGRIRAMDREIEEKRKEIDRMLKEMETWHDL